MSDIFTIYYVSPRLAYSSKYTLLHHSSCSHGHADRAGTRTVTLYVAKMQYPIAYGLAHAYISSIYTVLGWGLAFVFQWMRRYSSVHEMGNCIVRSFFVRRQP